MRRSPLIALALWFVIVFTLALGGPSLFAPPSVHPMLLPPGVANTGVPLLDALAMHEAIWRAANVTNYRIIVYHTNFLNDNQTEAIVVRGGTVVDRRIVCGHPPVTAPGTRCTMQHNEPDAFTAPDLFKLARQLAPDPTHHMRVTFDAQTGLPSTLSLHAGDESPVDLLPQRDTLYLLRVDQLDVLP